jgi:hypothetical protein
MGTRRISIVFGACSSLGGFPLEEASEQERIPSIIGSIVWCFPTSRVFIIIKWNYNIEKMINGEWKYYYGLENNCKLLNLWIQD